MGLSCGLGTVRLVLRINHSILLTQYGIGLRFGNCQASVMDKSWYIAHSVCPLPVAAGGSSWCWLAVAELSASVMDKS